jgi:hypothetical protein
MLFVEETSPLGRERCFGTAFLAFLALIVRPFLSFSAVLLLLRLHSLLFFLRTVKRLEKVF